MGLDTTKAKGAPRPPRTSAPSAPPAPQGSTSAAVVARRSPSPVVPVVPAASVGTLGLRPKPKFWICHHPDNWHVGQVDGQEVWLPTVAEIPFVPGTCGFKTRKATQAEEAGWLDGLNGLRKKGFTVMPWDCLVAGQRGYLFSYPTRSRSGLVGEYWVTIWHQPKYKRANARQKFQIDHALRNAWLMALVEEGHVDPPHADITQHKRARVITNISRNFRKTALAPEHRAELLVDLETSKAAYTNALVPRTGGASSYRVELEAMSDAALAKLGGPTLSGLDREAKIDILARIKMGQS